MVIDKDELKKLLTYENDNNKLDEYFQNAKDGIITFNSNVSAFLFWCTLYTLKKKYTSSCNITDFLDSTKIDKDSDFYKLYETLFIAETFYPSIEEAGQATIKPAVIGMHLGIAEYLLLTYRYMECLEYVADTLRIDKNNQTALFLKGLCLEALLQYGYNLKQKNMTLICDIYNSISVDNVYFDKNIVNSKLNHYKKIDVFILKNMGLVFTKATKAILNDIPNWNDEKTFYLTDKLFINPLSEIDGYVEAANESILPTGISCEINDLFKSIISDFEFCRRTLYEYNNATNKEKLNIVVTFNFLFTIFDKIGYLLYKYFDINMGKKTDELNEASVYLHTIFDKTLNGSTIKLSEVKNQYLYSLYHISREYSKNNKNNNFYNPMTIISKSIKLNRNVLMHRSTALTDQDTLYCITDYLAKVVKRSIIYTNLILYTEELRKSMNLQYSNFLFSDNYNFNLVDLKDDPIY